MTNWKDTVVVQDGDDIRFYQDDGCGDGNRWMDGRMGRWIDGWTVDWMVGWMYRWMDNSMTKHAQFRPFVFDFLLFELRED